ncbi:MAG TPA: helix-turn-helix domain-containing protein [Hyphomicrobiaceae bacterium]|nr:helix-turn-helix domain-containing protein [Hyphomicrobiaceae bacterium]
MVHWHDPVREAVRRAYVEGDETVIDISQRFGVSEHTIWRWRRAYGWPARGHRGRRLRRKPARASMRAYLIARLYRALLKNLDLLEKSMTEDEGAPRGDERSTRALGAIARTLEKLNDVEPGTDPAAVAPATAPKSRPRSAAAPELEEAERLRLELAERILKLRERGKP